MNWDGIMVFLGLQLDPTCSYVLDMVHLDPASIKKNPRSGSKRNWGSYESTQTMGSHYRSIKHTNGAFSTDLVHLDLASIKKTQDLDPRGIGLI